MNAKTVFVVFVQAIIYLLSLAPIRATGNVEGVRKYVDGVSQNLQLLSP